MDPRRDSDFDAEIESHIQIEADRLVEQKGMRLEDALAEARRAFGNVASHREEYYESRRWMPAERLRRDLVHAWRRLQHEPRFAATALLTIALCLGANLAIFAVVDAVLLRPLPFPAPQALVTIYNTYPGAQVPDDGASVANYYERRGHVPALSHVALFRYSTAILGERGMTEPEDIMSVTPEFFDTLGVSIAMGRGFSEHDLDGAGPPSVIITDAAWQRYFNRASDVIGRSIRANGAPATVIGVLPSSFRFLSSTAALYAPLSSRADERLSSARHSGSSSEMIARLAPGATIASAQTQIDAQNVLCEREDPQAAMMASVGFKSVVLSLHGKHVDAVKPVLLLLEGGAFALLLIGGVNLVNLLLVRAAGRAKEVAVRRALGASSWDLTRSILVETVSLTTLGGVLGTAAGAVGIRALSRLGANRLPLGADITLDMRVILAALAASIILGVVVALPVMWLTLRGRLAHGLRSESRGGTPSRAAQRLRHGFVVAEIAIALTLLAAAGLLSVSVQRTLSVAPGFVPDHTLTGRVTLPWQSYRRSASRLAFTDRALELIAQQPGVVAAAVSNNVPLSGDVLMSAVTVADETLRRGVVPRGSYGYWVGGDYFNAMRITLVEGRYLDAADSHRSTRVCVVDDDFARLHFPDGRVIGRRVFQGSSVGKDEEAYTIVGVVGAVKQTALTDVVAQGAIYYPYVYRTDNVLFLIARTKGSAETLAPVLQRIVRSVDPELPVSDLRSMDDRVSDSLLTRRSPAALALFFAAMALLLASIGTYGVLSYAVAQRRREIGLRLALGAQPFEIVRHFLSMGWRLFAVGAVLGLIGAVLVGRSVQSMLFGVSAIHVATLIGSVVVMAAVTMVACALPSRRAARISPVEAMAED